MTQELLEPPQKGRDENGKWLPGTSPNPNGYNGLKKGYQPYGKRAAYLMEQYSTEDMLDIYNDKDRFKKLSVMDAMIFTNIVGAILGKDPGMERERLLNRLEGQPKQTVDLNVDGELKSTHDLGNSARKFIESQLAGIRERLGAEGILRQPEPAGAARPEVGLELLGEAKPTSA